MSTVKLSHCEMHYEVEGEGVDVVCVHGWPLHGATFRKVVPDLSARCWSVDLPGAGLTKTTPETEYTIKAQAETLIEFLDAAGIERCIFLAHDSGGAVARFAAAEIGDRTLGLVLCGTEIPHVITVPFRLLLASVHLPFARANIRAAFKTPILRNRSFSLGGAFGDMTAIDGDFVRLFVKPFLADDAVADGYLSIARAFKVADVNKLVDIHKKIESPVLLLWGRRDPFFPSSDAKEMGSQFAGDVEFVEHPDGKLFLHEEFPQWFSDQTNRFIDAI